MGLLAKARYPNKVAVRGVDTIYGRLTCNGAGVPVKLAPAVGWNAARTAAGNITITLDQAYKRILYADGSLVGVTGNTKSAKPIALNEGGIRAGASVVFELQNTDGAAADQTIDLVFQISACQVEVMATNRTMLMAMGKLGKKGAPADDAEEGEGYEADAGGPEEGDEEEPDDKKQAFVDMCKAIRAGKDDKAYELYQDICEGM